MSALERRRLGRTGLRPRALGVGGAWWSAGTEAECIAGIHRALELGLDFFDTYPGDFEERWGKALAGRRHEVVLQGKVSSVARRRSDHTAAATRQSVEASLRALGTDYLDIALIHGYDQPEDVPAGAGPEARGKNGMVDPLAPGQALDELERLRAEGKVRCIGLGGRAAAVLRRALETGRVDVVLTYLEYNLFTQAFAAEVMPAVRACDAGVELASPLGMGLLAGPRPDPQSPRGGAGGAARALAMWEWCQAWGVEIRHLAMQFCLAAPVPGIVLPGPANRRELDEAHEAATAPIPPPVWQAFRAEFGVGI
ncbi:MAG: aldo/keto reductase [Gemmatimonadota bacterium]